MTQPQTIGQRKENVKVSNMSDPWGEAPFYAPPSESSKSSEHLNIIEEGTVICATFHGLRKSKNAIESKRRSYAVFTLEDGQKIRLFTPAQLAGILKNVEPKTYVEITYLGKKDYQGEMIHNFDVKVDERVLN